MGAWGTGIFSDDTACDIRDDFRTLLGDGVNSHEATRQILDEWSDALADDDERPVIWLALAATQWSIGRLQDHVRDQALSIIEHGVDLRKWADDPRLCKKRRAVLEKLAAQLRTPQPPPRNIRKRYRDDCDWQPGEVIGYRLRSGRWIMLLVIGQHTDKGGTAPICCLFDWVGDAIPSAIEIAQIKVRAHHLRSQQTARFGIYRTSEKQRPSDRVIRTGIKVQPPPTDNFRGGIGVYLWRDFDDDLKRDYELA